jgi:hypothetical protein
MIYNTYFYIFKLVEICKDVPLLIDSSNNLGINLNANANPIYPKNDLISVNSGTAKHKNTAKIRTSKEMEKAPNDQNETPESKSTKNSNNDKIYKVQGFSYVTPLVMVILGSLLITYIIILLYQRSMVTSSHKGFLIFYYNYYQRDQLYALYSVTLSSYYHYMNTTDFSDVMNETDYIDLIKRYSIEFQNSFHIFYDIYISYNNEDTSQIHFIFDENEVFKISNYFNQTSTIGDYIKEAEYISYISRLCSIKDNLTDIIEDSKLLFFGNIFDNSEGQKTKTKTYYIQMLYYLSKNYETLFNKIFSALEKESTEQFNQLSKKTKATYLCIEIMGFLIIISFFIIVLIFLHQTNTAIFRNIVNMFINYNSQDETFHYKNKKDNYLLIKIISGFAILMNDFNLDNLHKLQNTINQSSNSKSISLDSTLDIKDDNNTNISIGLIEEEKNKNGDIKNTKTTNYSINIINSKNGIMNHMLENKGNNSELLKLNISSSKTGLQYNSSNGDPLKSLNNIQKSVDFTSSSNNSTIMNSKTLSKKRLIINTLGNAITSVNKNSHNSIYSNKSYK